MLCVDLYCCNKAIYAQCKDPVIKVSSACTVDSGRNKQRIWLALKVSVITCTRISANQMQLLDHSWQGPSRRSTMITTSNAPSQLSECRKWRPRARDMGTTWEAMPRTIWKSAVWYVDMMSKRTMCPGVDLSSRTTCRKWAVCRVDIWNVRVSCPVLGLQ